MLDKELQKVKTAISYINSSRSLLLEVLEEFGKSLENPIRENMGVDYSKINTAAAVRILAAQGIESSGIADRLNISLATVHKYRSKSFISKKAKKVKSVSSKAIQKAAFIARANELLSDKKLLAPQLASILGKEFNCARSTVYRLLKKSEDKIAYQDRGIRGTVGAQMATEAMERYAKGESLAEIAKDYNLKPAALYKRIQAHGHNLKNNKAARDALLVKNTELLNKLMTTESDPEVTIDGISDKLSNFLVRWGLK